MLDLLLFSNSTNHGSGYLEHARGAVAGFLADIDEVLFVPYALADHDAYTDKVRAALDVFNVRTVGLHTAADPAAAVAGSRAVFVGGGNTFRLVGRLQELGLMAPLRAAVTAGTKYMSASAGTNITSPTLRTTNDMPIVEPASFATLGLVPFQINPHYLDADPASRHAGETRETRLTEFLEANDVPVLGLREGTHLRVQGTPADPSFAATVGGAAVDPAKGPAVVFRRGQPVLEADGDIGWLFPYPARFDAG